jgi:hypothetical protein
MTLEPGRCRFRVQFDLPEMLHLVTILASAGQVLITPAAKHPATASGDIPPIGVIVDDAARVVTAFRL